jgi:hypothetical protein
MRYRLIELVSDKRKHTDEAVIFTVRGAPGPNCIQVRYKMKSRSGSYLSFLIICISDKMALARIDDDPGG